jgi:hypothetical protein
VGRRRLTRPLSRSRYPWPHRGTSPTHPRPLPAVDHQSAAELEPLPRRLPRLRRHLCRRSGHRSGPRLAHRDHHGPALAPAAPARCCRRADPRPRPAGRPQGDYKYRTATPQRAPNRAGSLAMSSPLITLPSIWPAGAPATVGRDLVDVAAGRQVPVGSDTAMTLVVPVAG